VKRVVGWMLALGLGLMIAAPVWAAPGATAELKPGRPDGTWRIENGEKVVVKSEVIPGDLIFNGDQLEIDGVVQGDLIILSGNVVIGGAVEGSVIGLTGGKVTVNGRIGRNLRVLAQDIYINGNIEGSSTVGAFRMVTAPNSRIGNGLMGTFIMLELTGRVEGMASVTSMSFAKIGGQIHGDLKVSGTQLQWAPPLEVSGQVTDATSTAHNPSKIKGVKLGGYRLDKGNLADQYQMMRTVMIVLFIWFVGSLLLSLIFFRLFPRITWSMSEPSMANFRRSLLIGLLCLIGTPVLIYFLCLSMVGIPIAIFLLLLYLLLLMGFGIPVYLWLGRLIFKSKLRPGMMIVMGALFQAIIFFIWPAFLVSVCVGMGMIIGKIRFQFRERIEMKV
jgi:hypothetical protein